MGFLILLFSLLNWFLIKNVVLKLVIAIIIFIIAEVLRRNNDSKMVVVGQIIAAVVVIGCIISFVLVQIVNHVPTKSTENSNDTFVSQSSKVLVSELELYATELALERLGSNYDLIDVINKYNQESSSVNLKIENDSLFVEDNINNVEYSCLLEKISCKAVITCSEYVANINLKNDGC